MDSKAAVLRVLELEAQAILDRKTALEKADATEWTPFRQALDLLSSALDQGGKIVVCGLGKSGKIAEKIASTLRSTGAVAVYLHPLEALHGDLGMISKAHASGSSHHPSRDVLLALSQSGNTEVWAELLPSIKQRGVSVVSICGNPNSLLARGSDLVISSGVSFEACPHGLAPTTSTTLMLALGDALAVTLMQMRSIDAKDFARNHPAGALGRRLSWRVRDVLGDSPVIPVVLKDALIEEVLEVSTRAHLGGVCVVRSQQAPLELIGLITDGDIRRALSKKDRFFTLKAHEIMTSSPMSLSSESLAFDALQLMSAGPRQVTVMPILDSSGRLYGLLRLLDLAHLF